MLQNLMFAIQLFVRTGPIGKRPCLVQRLVVADYHFEHVFVSMAHPMSRQSVPEKSLKIPNAIHKNVHFGLLGSTNQNVPQHVVEEKFKDQDYVSMVLQMNHPSVRATRTIRQIATPNHVHFGRTGQSGQNAQPNVIAEPKHVSESAHTVVQVMMVVMVMPLKLFNVKMQNVKPGQNGNHGHLALFLVPGDQRHENEIAWAR